MGIRRGRPLFFRYNLGFKVWLDVLCVHGGVAQEHPLRLICGAAQSLLLFGLIVKEIKETILFLRLLNFNLLETGLGDADGKENISSDEDEHHESHDSHDKADDEGGEHELDHQEGMRPIEEKLQDLSDDSSAYACQHAEFVELLGVFDQENPYNY